MESTHLMGADSSTENSRGRCRETNLQAEPQRHSWLIVASGAVVPLGLGAAAAITTRLTTHERVAMTAWIAVAIVGTASVIANAVASSRRTWSAVAQDEKLRAKMPDVR